MAAALLAAGCGPRDPVLTYYNGEYGLSLRYPAGWRSRQKVEDGVLRRTFVPPDAGSEDAPALSVTFFARRGEGRLEDDAKPYLLADRVETPSQEERRGGAEGRSYSFASADGSRRYSLLVLREKEQAYGLYAEGAAAPFQKHAPAIEAMGRSLAPERTADYPLLREEEFKLSLRTPPSWRQTRRFAGAGTLLLQYMSPALGADRSGQTVHAFLTASVEPVAQGTTRDDFYQATVRKLGENFGILDHDVWGKDGYADVMRTETPLAASNVKRFLRVDGGRGYSLAFESRDDVFPRAARWYDQIASSLRTGDEMEK